MRTSLIMLGLTGILVACGQSDEYPDGAGGYEARSDETEAERVAPDIDPSAAPGVAFDYAMRLGVPDERISELQEQHADACEELGLARCQIVGMQFDRSVDGQVSGQLTFLLVPSDARPFARQAVDGAEEIAGTLLSSQFSGEEVQTAIDDSRRRGNRTEERLAEIERTLNRSGLSEDRRTQLETEAAQLRAGLSSETQAQEANERRLAKSPLTISYVGEYSYGRKPLTQIGDEALGAGRTSLTMLFTVLIYLVTVILPWLISGALLIYGVRWLFGRIRSWREKRPVAVSDAGDYA